MTKKLNYLYRSYIYRYYILLLFYSCLLLWLARCATRGREWSKAGLLFAHPKPERLIVLADGLAALLLMIG